MSDIDPRAGKKTGADSDPKGAFSLSAIAAARPMTGETIPPARQIELSAEARRIAETFATSSMSPRLIAGLARIFEFVAIAALGLGVYLVYVVPDNGFNGFYVAPLVIGAGLNVALVQGMGGYEIAAFRTVLMQFGRIFAAWTIVFAFFALAFFFAKIGEQFSRVWFGSWYFAGILFYLAYRPLLAALVTRWTREGRLERRAVIVGGGQMAADLINALEAQPEQDIRICGIFDDRGDDRSPPVVAGYPKLGNIAELVEFCRLAHVDMLIVALPITAEARVLQILRQLWVLPVDIRLSAQTNKLRFRPRSYSYVGTVPLLDVVDKPIADWDYIVKRSFDAIVSAVLIVLFSPILLATAMAIKLDSKGPALFRQNRYGFNNEIIRIFKFRSMYVDQTDANASRLVTRDDPRVTRVGRFIRKTSIDELPQLFNVLMGDLSLVGPRPHALQAKADQRLYQDVVDGYYARHRVKPGITGWAQIKGWRGETDTREKILKRVEHDIYYIENWSVMLDLYILAMTPLSLVRTESAY